MHEIGQHRRRGIADPGLPRPRERASHDVERYRGKRALRNQRAYLVRAQPTRGRDVEDARTVLDHGRDQRGHEIVDVEHLHRSPLAPHPRPAPAGEQPGKQVLRAGAEHRRGPQDGDHGVGMRFSPTRAAVARSRPRGPRARNRSWDAVAHPRSTGTGLVGHAPYTAAVETRTILRTPTAAAASRTRRVPSTLTRAINASSTIGSTTAAR